jgi:hypothetical protein
MMSNNKELTFLVARPYSHASDVYRRSSYVTLLS